MALPVNIDDLIHQRKVERTRIEYKADWNPEPILHTITAFANDFDNMGGGYILIGVEEENGRPVLPLKGLDPDSLDGIQLDLLNKCNFIEPRYIPVIEPCTVDGKPQKFSRNIHLSRHLREKHFNSPTPYCFISCYQIFPSIVFSLIKSHMTIWDDITQGKI